eukprot:12386899-Alexandrium_andersonii.AAC.1
MGSSPVSPCGSPPCADWCSLNVNVNHPRVGPVEVQGRTRRAQARLEFVVKLYQSPRFLREHSVSASSRRESCMVELLVRPGA